MKLKKTSVYPIDFCNSVIIMYYIFFREWLHANHRRIVKLRFGPEACLHTVDRKGEKLRSVSFKNGDTITVEESQVFNKKTTYRI